MAYLQKDTEGQFTIDRFRIFNTNSLELPYSVLHSDLLVAGEMNAPVTDSLSSRITDEAFPLKAKLDDFASGFTYIIFNPPYVSSKREEIGIQRLRNADFFSSVLSGDANLFLLFIKLASYYLSDYGRTVFIIPLTIFGDKSSAAARSLLRTAPLSTSATIRFYRGDVLFPGVDQAVGILRVEKTVVPNTITVAGGNTIAEVSANQYELSSASVLDAVPAINPWNGAWLVSNNSVHAAIWEKVKSDSQQFAQTMGGLILAAFSARQGDVNATHLNPYRAGRGLGSYAAGQIAVYKGEDINAFAPLSLEPSDWVNSTLLQSDDSATNRTLNAAKVSPREVGIARREVARLNTRERLIGTWFERDSTNPLVFTHETWRLVLRPQVTEVHGKAILSLLSSKSVAFLLNLFSTNNHVGSEELNRVPVPSTNTFPEAELSRLADDLLGTRSTLDAIVRLYNASIPDADDLGSDIYLPPATVLNADAGRRTISIANLVLRDIIQNTGANTARLRSLNRSNRITIAPPTGTNAEAVTETIRLFLNAPVFQDRTWAQVQGELLPEPIVAADFLAHYRAETKSVLTLWQQFVALQQEVDRVVCDWYGFNAAERAAIAAGLPWARRRVAAPDTNAVAPYVPQTERQSVTSSLVAAIGYDESIALLEVELVSGETYGYAPVPSELYQAFRDATSKGTFYNESIKGVIPRSPAV